MDRALLNEAVMVISFTLTVDNPALKVNDLKNCVGKDN